VRNAVSPVETKRYFIGSLARGLEIMSCFSHDSQPLSLSELARRTGWNKSVVFRYAFTLQSLGYLQQDPATKLYRPGVKVLGLGFGFLSSMGLTEHAQSHLEDLFQQTRQPTHLAVLDGSDIVYVARRADRSLTSINVYVGARLPAYCTSMGKVLLAYLPWPEVEQLLGAVPLKRHTPNTITSLGQLHEDLDRIRQRGYGSTDQELELGVRSVAAPIRDASGEVIAAVNLSTLVARVSLEELHQELLPKLLSAANKISTAHGYLPGAEAMAV
jgi:IclR family pca regulon transcriptional regulator